MKRYLIILVGLLIYGCYGCDSSDSELDSMDPTPVIPTVGKNDTISVVSFGTKGDGVSDDTKAIQNAIDSCEGKSATLIIPAGTYYTRPLFLKSNITILFEEGSTLLGSNKVQDYKDAFPNTTSLDTPALLYGKGISHVNLKGKGIINGQGDGSEFQFGNNLGVGTRHKNILFINSSDIVIEDLKIWNAAFWNVHLFNCENVHIKGLNIYSHANWNNDGIDIDGRNITVEDCNIDVDDDAICLKSEFREGCENIVVKNCTVASNCNAIKFGTASYGGFKNVRISDCTVVATRENNFRQNATWEGAISKNLAISGIAIESVDGGVIDDIEISRINMEAVRVPIFIRLGDRSRKYNGKISELRNVIISDINAKSGGKTASSITGVPGGVIENIQIKNVSIELLGGGKRSDIKSVPECIADYPEAIMFGQILPASAFYVRHARNVTFDNVNLSFQTPDERDAYVFDNADDDDSAFASGTGTQADPYKISTAEHLNKIRDYSTAHFQLANDIDLAEWISENTDADIQTKGWNPIPVFYGTLDGNGFSIKGIWCKREWNVALFSNLNGATIKRLGLITSPAGIEGSGANIAGFASLTDKDTQVTIEECYFDGEIKSVGRAGGIIASAQARTLIKDCYTTGYITGGDGTGGIIGRSLAESATASKSTIKNCYSASEIYVTAGAGGGIVGTLSHYGNLAPGDVILEITNCVSANVSITAPAGGRITVWLKDGYTYVVATGNRGYENTQVNAQSVSGVANSDPNGASVSASELMNASSYAGWDFTNIWKLGNGQYQLPVLKNNELNNQPSSKLPHM